VTEACLADDEPERLAVLCALKASGIAVTLADFGAGASSLKRLMAFPFDHIVIVVTFVADIPVRSLLHRCRSDGNEPGSESRVISDRAGQNPAAALPKPAPFKPAVDLEPRPA
jgi:hypothetical protein